MNTQPASPKTADSSSGYGVFATERTLNGSRTPIDTHGHWDWHNPFNVLPIGIALIVLAALVAALI